ncbi:hypothetical protein BDQ17DRAFT_422786 [Cyathus striatus]|nr:hypothetical protein BDQ17DRAFT_422786 [Cyathus striatus]
MYRKYLSICLWLSPLACFEAKCNVVVVDASIISTSCTTTNPLSSPYSNESSSNAALLADNNRCWIVAGTFRLIAEERNMRTELVKVR